jgi:hypothetical protein
MGACAIYTAIPDPRLVEDVLACFDFDSQVENANIHARGWHRLGLGRLAVMALAEAFTPASHREVVHALRARGSYAAFTPVSAHYRGPPVFDELPPRWPSSAALATIVGCSPASYHGWHRRSSAGVALIEPALVGAALDELRSHTPGELPPADTLDTRALAQTWIAWLAATHARRDHVVLHWEMG